IIGTDGNMGHVYAFDKSTGGVRWKYKVNEHGVSSDIVLLDGKLYALTLGDELLCLDLKTGAPIWTFHTSYSGEDTCLSCSSPGAVVARVYLGVQDGLAYALDAQSGRLNWKRQLSGRVTTAATLHEGNLYLGTKNRHVFRIDRVSGEVLNDFAT